MARVDPTENSSVGRVTCGRRLRLRRGAERGQGDGARLRPSRGVGLTTNTRTEIFPLGTAIHLIWQPVLLSQDCLSCRAVLLQRSQKSEADDGNNRIASEKSDRQLSSRTAISSNEPMRRSRRAKSPATQTDEGDLASEYRARPSNRLPSARLM
jgi:hypothetical protein